MKWTHITKTYVLGGDKKLVPGASAQYKTILAHGIGKINKDKLLNGMLGDRSFLFPLL